MSVEVTLTLPDQLYQYAQWWADVTGQDLSDALTEALTLTLTPLYHPAITIQTPISTLADDEVLILSELKMAPQQGNRLSLLLKKQREAQLTQSEKNELMTLAQIYGQLWVRQSEALLEAVKRGLRPPLEG